MAAVQLLSDLHLEFLPPGKDLAWIEALDPEGVDVLILAGDICTLSRMGEVLSAFCGKYSEVVYVTGNHEYYGRSPAQVHGELWDICVKNKNLHWLNNETVVVAGLKFCGGTLWFPEPEIRTLALGRRSLNDYRMIRDFEPWVYEQNTLCVEMLKAQAGEADIVVTHHLPSSTFIAPRFRREGAMNHFFCHDMTRLIEEAQPPLWVFGHTHDRMWTYLKDAVCVCNPLGYPHEPESKERGQYVPKCLIKMSDFEYHAGYDAQVRGVKKRTAHIQGLAPGPGLPGNR